MINTVLFDMDGTLVNSEKFYVDGTLDWTKRLGYNISYEEAVKIIGNDYPGTINYLSKLLNRSYDEIERINTDYFTVEHTLDYRNYQFDDVMPTLKELKKRNIKIIICSTSDSDAVEQFINQLEIQDYIDGYYGGDTVTKHKPDPEVYLKAMEEFKLSKENCVCVEDSYKGIAASKNAGLLTCARRDKQFGMDQTHADIILENLFDVIKVIDNGK